ncbi:hypothetical protein OXI21_01485 [Ignatzschineria sp. RMDPL8A]|uniref:hypothetical protein n=1 Tax=Ignatzschineria sp. RMDPL8A TaxID=2999236 RepID=UPI002446796D|nr:hypothetical protein [Ignatzschineria sp. RMDPL8A]MDG9729094.1 hypothetical protein [Ignatzschineria sp. RMDPL8A]
MKQANKLKKDKTQRLWGLFLTRGRVGLTCYDAVMYADYHRLAAYVHAKIAAGVPIQSLWETDADGNRYKRYWLEPAANDSDFRQRKSADTDQSSSANSRKPKK